MQNFYFYNPTKIIFGANTIAQLNDLVPENAKILILYGGSSAEKTGTLSEVRHALGNRTIHLFGGIEPNPTYETLMEAVKQVHQKKLDFLIAVGGGSVIDGAKFVSVAAQEANYLDDPWEIVQTQGMNIKKAIPLATILTLPATGSEMNRFAVISRKETRAKLSFQHEALFPVFSILDPTKTYTLPPSQIANGIVDSFVHIIEQYLTYPIPAMAQDQFNVGCNISTEWINQRRRTTRLVNSFNRT